MENLKAPIKVGVVDSTSLFRTGVRAALGGHDPIEVVSEAQTVEQLFLTFETTEKPNVVILNLRHDNANVLQLVSELVQKYPQVAIIALGTLQEEVQAARVLKAGGAAYLTIDCNPNELAEAVKAVSSGRIYLTSKATSVVIDQLQNKNVSQTLPPHSLLSAREYQIFTLICNGKPLVRIGQDFGISVKTVSTYRSRILKKMSMTNNAELIQYAVRNKIVETLSA